MGGGGDAPEIEPTAQDYALSEVVTQQWDRYQNVLKPIETKWLTTLEKTPADVSIATGEIRHGVGEKFAEETKANVGTSFARGFRPGSGKTTAAIGGMGIDQGKTQASGMVRGGEAMNDASLINLQNAIKMGRGQATGTQSDLTTLSRRATEEAIGKGFRKADAQDTIGSNVASAMGMGLAGWQDLKSGGK